MELVELLRLNISALLAKEGLKGRGRRVSATITVTDMLRTIINLHEHLRGWKKGNQADKLNGWRRRRRQEEEEKEGRHRGG